MARPTKYSRRRAKKQQPKRRTRTTRTAPKKRTAKKTAKSAPKKRRVQKTRTKRAAPKRKPVQKTRTKRAPAKRKSAPKKKTRQPGPRTKLVQQALKHVLDAADKGHRGRMPATERILKRLRSLDDKALKFITAVNGAYRYWGNYASRWDRSDYADDYGARPDFNAYWYQ